MTAYIVLQLTSTISRRLHKPSPSVATATRGVLFRPARDSQSNCLAGCLIPGTTTGALHYISNSADRNHGYDKEDGDEPHSLLQNELRHRTTFPAMHRIGRQVGTPGEKVCADYEHLVFSIRLL